METKIFKIIPDDTDSPLMDEAAETLVRGGLVAFPTETVYGPSHNTPDCMR